MKTAPARPIRYLSLPLVCVMLATSACSGGNTPSQAEVMAQVEKALTTRTAPGPNSEVKDYFPCEPYQKVAHLLFRAVAPKAPGTAVAIVQIDYEYTRSYLRVLDDLQAGKRLANYGRVSCAHLDSPQYLHEHTFDQGGHFIVDGLFTFARSEGGWQLQ